MKKTRSLGFSCHDKSLCGQVTLSYLPKYSHTNSCVTIKSFADIFIDLTPHCKPKLTSWSINCCVTNFNKTSRCYHRNHHPLQTKDSFLINHLGKCSFEGGGDGAVDDEVGGEVEHDEEVSHGLQAHHPQGRDVLVILLHTSNLFLCKAKNVDKYLWFWSAPTRATTRMPRKILRALQTMCMSTMEERVMARLISPSRWRLSLPLKMFRVLLVRMDDKLEQNKSVSWNITYMDHLGLS